MTRLSSVLTQRDLPVAELWAARLDGELFAVDECFSPVDQCDNATQRAAAIAAHWPERVIAEQRTAAWIWGALAFPPARHDLCAHLGARVRPTNAARITVREVLLDDDELVLVGALRVTTPVRTAVDLVRFSESFGDTEAAVIRSLMAIGDFGLIECRAALDRRRNLPRKIIAWQRLESAVLGVRLSPN